MEGALRWMRLHLFGRSEIVTLHLILAGLLGLADVALEWVAMAIWPTGPFLWLYVAGTTAWLLDSGDNVGALLGWTERSSLLRALEIDRWRPIFFLFLLLLVRLARREVRDEGPTGRGESSPGTGDGNEAGNG